MDGYYDQDYELPPYGQQWANQSGSTVLNVPADSNAGKRMSTVGSGSQLELASSSQAPLQPAYSQAGQAGGQGSYGQAGKAGAYNPQGSYSQQGAASAAAYYDNNADAQGPANNYYAPVGYDQNAGGGAY